MFNQDGLLQKSWCANLNQYPYFLIPNSFSNSTLSFFSVNLKTAYLSCFVSLYLLSVLKPHCLLLALRTTLLPPKSYLLTATHLSDDSSDSTFAGKLSSFKLDQITCVIYSQGSLNLSFIVLITNCNQMFLSTITQISVSYTIL